MCKLWQRAQKCNAASHVHIFLQSVFSPSFWVFQHVLCVSSFGPSLKLLFRASQRCVVSAGAPLGSRHYHCHCSLQKLWPFFLGEAKWSPYILLWCFAPRDGYHTEKPPPTGLPYCLDNTQHHLLSPLILSPSLWGSVFPSLTFFVTFMSFFAPLSHLSRLLFGSLCLFPHCSFIVALVITSHIRYVGPRCMACSVCLCAWFHILKAFPKALQALFSLFRMNHLGSLFWILKTYKTLAHADNIHLLFHYFSPCSVNE